MTAEKRPVQQFRLEPDWELRFEVDTKNEKVTLELKSGSAEVFGTELIQKGKKYEFTYGAKVGVFTWHGCTVELIGKTDVTYIAKETPMNRYLNCHATMERMRKMAEKDGTRGPIVMVVGPGDVGKSTLCKLLLNYAVRMGRRPIYVDLDVAQGHIAIPGTVGALLVKSPSDVVHGFEQQAPLVFHFGSTNPNSNSVLYNLLVSRLARVCSNRLQANRKSNVSGIVINTCGSMKDGSYKMLAHAAQAFEVDVILVLDQERLYSQLVRDMPDSVKVIFLPKSGGVVERTQTQKNEARNQLVREYFYGTRVNPLYPYSFEFKWSEAKLFKIGAPILPSSCMPLGMKAEDNLTKLVAVTPGPSLLYHLLSVSFANSPQDVIERNVAGFICVTDVNTDRQTMTILSSQPMILQNYILLLSESQFMDN